MFQQPVVDGAGEGDGQPPELVPAAAVALLDDAAVSGQALRAVTAESGEDPVFFDEQAADDAAVPATYWVQRRVAGAEAVQCHGRDVGGGEPGGVREHGGAVGGEGEHAAGAGAVWGLGESGELFEPGGGQFEAVRQAQHVAGQ